MFFKKNFKLKFPKLSFQVLQAPTYTWQEGENTRPQQITQGEQQQATTQRRVKWVHE